MAIKGWKLKSGVPEYPDLQKRIETLRSRLSSGSKYDFLLRQQLVTTEQLQKSAVLSKQTRKSVETVLIENFGISKDDIAKSFSQFYGCTFRSYEEDLPTPYELLGNLKKAFLLHELWVPLNWGKDGVVVLVADPRDLNKTDNIKALMKTGKINFCVAIREDIEAYIKRFYSTDQYSDMAQGADGQDQFDDILDVEFDSVTAFDLISRKRYHFSR